MCATGVGLFQEAIDAFREAIGITEHTGDALMGGVLWSNMSTVYENFGFFGKAAESVARAIELSHDAGTPRARTILSARAASLAILLGNEDQARIFIQSAEQNAREVGLWVYQVGALIVRCEYLISQDEQELAWPLVEKAVKTAGMRVCAPSEIAGLERLKHQWLVATEGHEAIKNWEELEEPDMKRRIVERLELEALDEWSASRNGILRNRDSVFGEIRSRGLLGVLARLNALGIWIDDLKNKERTESSAQLVARLFPDPERGAPPSAIPASLQVA
jgi:hypothetical protein